MGVSITAWGSNRLTRYVSPFVPAIALVAVQLIWFGMPAGGWVRGVVLGLLTALLAMGMALVYRANRVINFAQADLGFVPTTLAVGLIIFSGLPYLFGFGLGMVGGGRTRRRRRVLARQTIRQVVASRPDRRHDRHHPAARRAGPARAAHLGRERHLAAHPAAVRLEADDRHVHPQRQRPDRLDRRSDRDGRRGAVPRQARGSAPPSAAPPSRASGRRCSASRSPGCRRSSGRSPPGSRSSPCSSAPASRRADRLGAEHRRTRASPRRTRHRTPPPPADRGDHGRRPRHPRVRRRLERQQPAPRHADRRGRGARSHCCCSVASTAGPTPTRPPRGGSVTRSVRSTPRVARLPLVRLMRVGVGVLVLAGVVAVPLLLRSDQIIKASAVGVYAIIGLSLVVLTGWAGQISLGQMGFVAIGAAVAGKCTSEWNLDLNLALLAGGAAGAVAAFVVGLPALRLRGPVPRRHHPRVRARGFVVAPQRPVLRLGAEAAARTPAAVRPDRHQHADAVLRLHARRPRRSSTSPCAASGTVALAERSSVCGRTSGPRRPTRCAPSR